MQQQKFSQLHVLVVAANCEPSSYAASYAAAAGLDE
jgi:hypothetical protein